MYNSGHVQKQTEIFETRATVTQRINQSLVNLNYNSLCVMHDCVKTVQFLCTSRSKDRIYIF